MISLVFSHCFGFSSQPATPPLRALWATWRTWRAAERRFCPGFVAAGAGDLHALKCLK